MPQLYETREVVVNGCPRCQARGRGRLHELTRCRKCGQLVTLVPITIAVPVESSPVAATDRRGWRQRLSGFLGWYSKTMLTAVNNSGSVGKRVFAVFCVGLFCVFCMPIAIVRNAVSPTLASWIAVPWAFIAIAAAMLVAALIVIQFNEQFVDNDGIWTEDE